MAAHALRAVVVLACCTRARTHDECPAALGTSLSRASVCARVARRRPCDMLALPMLLQLLPLHLQE
eukprot:15299932-Alexandrium_andersonii.AAC.1